MDAGQCIGFANPLAQGVLRGNAGDQCGLWRRQKVIGRAYEKLGRVSDFIELKIGTDGRKLRNPRPSRVGTEGFKIVK